MKSEKNEVKQLIDKLTDRYNNLPEGPLHPMDADLMLSLLRQLYEQVETLRNRQPVEPMVKAERLQYSKPEMSKSGEPVAPPLEIPPVEPIIMPSYETRTVPDIQPEVQPIEQPQYASPVVTFVETPSAQESRSEIQPEEQQPPAAYVAPEEKPHIKNEFIAEHEFKRDPGPLFSKPTPPPADLFGHTLSDMFKSDSPSVNDSITSGRHDQTLAERIHLKPISDMKTAIGINEKFQFINELFEGSADRYNEAINLLNVCSGAGEAGLLFDDLKSRYSWDELNPFYERLHEFIIRRYLPKKN